MLPPDFSADPVRAARFEREYLSLLGQSAEADRRTAHVQLGCLYLTQRRLKEAGRLGVTRQSMIKVWIAERLGHGTA